MPHPRHRRLKKNQIGAIVLIPAGLTNVANGDTLSTTNISYLQNDALYSVDGVSPSFTEGSTDLLTDAVSNGDGLWTLMGYAGETTANTSGFFKSGTIHRYLPYAGATTTALTDSTTVVIYSKDGPQSYFNQFYAPTTAQVNGSGSLRFANQITGAAGAQTKLRVWIAGGVPTGSVGSTVTVFTGSNGPQGTALLTFSASATPLMQSASFTYDATTILTLRYSSSANTYNLNSFVPGVLVYITGSN